MSIVSILLTSGKKPLQYDVSTRHLFMSHGTCSLVRVKVVTFEPNYTHRKSLGMRLAVTCYILSPQATILPPQV